ncbi:Hypothetical protein A7982_06158 [Minicystis rosea]|nr:Hypothetical protein A7982_06158 [Minicystis rosea]
MVAASSRRRSRVSAHAATDAWPPDRRGPIRPALPSLTDHQERIMSKTFSILAVLIAAFGVPTPASAKEVKKQISNPPKKPCKQACEAYASNHGIAGSLQSVTTYPSGACDCVWALQVAPTGVYHDFYDCWSDMRFGDLVEGDARATCFEPVYGDAVILPSLESSIDALVDQANEDVSSLLSVYGDHFEQVIAASGGSISKTVRERWSTFYPCWTELEVPAPDTTLYGACWASTYGDLKLSAATEAGIADIATELGNELGQLNEQYSSLFEPLFDTIADK